MDSELKHVFVAHIMSFIFLKNPFVITNVTIFLLNHIKYIKENLYFNNKKQGCNNNTDLGVSLFWIFRKR